MENLRCSNVIQSSVAMRKPLVKALKEVFPKMSLMQIKLFFILLEHIDWRSKVPYQLVFIDNEVAKYRLERKDKTPFSFAGVMRREYRNIISLSKVTVKIYGQPEITDFLFTGVYANNDFTVVALNPAFIKYFTHVDRVTGANMKRDYFQYSVEDIMNFTSKNSLCLYLELRTRQKYDKTLHMPVNAVNTEVRFHTKNLKEVFGLSKSDYTQTIDGVQHFNRTSFEKKVLRPALQETSQSKMIKILPPIEDECGIHEELFRKTKYNNRIKYYYIHFLTQEEIFIEQEGQYIDKEKLKEIQTRFYYLYMNNKKFIRFVEEVEQIK